MNANLGLTTTSPTNITFGAQTDTFYSNQTSFLNLTADQTTGTYYLSKQQSGVLGLGFGQIQGSTQWYYKNLLVDSPVYGASFNVNFLGLGLVGSSYTTFVNLLNSVASPAFSCDISTGGYCSSVSACETYSNLWEFSFQVAFAQAPSTYLIVPLSTFATSYTDSTGSYGCGLFVTGLNSSVTGNNQTIFGSQFFTNYFGVFTDNYNTTPVSQSAQIFVAQNALSTTLLSSTARTTGSDVFPAPPPPTYSKVLVICLGCAGGALLIALLVVSICLCKKRNQSEAETLVYRVNPSDREGSDAPLV